MAKISKQILIRMPTPEESREIIAAAKSDPDARPWPGRQLQNIKPGSMSRGRPTSGKARTLISMRFSPEVLAYFRADGDGWQTRMNDVLVAYVRKRAK